MFTMMILYRQYCSVVRSIFHLGPIVVSMMPVQKAAASCETNPKNGARACSGNGSTCGPDGCLCPGSVSTCSVAGSSTGLHVAGTSSDAIRQNANPDTRQNSISTSHNFGGEGNCADTTCSGK